MDHIKNKPNSISKIEKLGMFLFHQTNVEQNTITIEGKEMKNVK